jgi:hypothetical protein
MAAAAEPKIQYVDRPELNETFADSIGNVTFDGATVRAELCVTRPEDGGRTPSARRTPACRLVLRPDAAVDLFLRLQRLIALMEQRGIVKRQEPKKTGKGTEESLPNPLGSGTKN